VGTTLRTPRGGFLGRRIERSSLCVSAVSVIPFLFFAQMTRRTQKSQRNQSNLLLPVAVCASRQLSGFVQRPQRSSPALSYSLQVSLEASRVRVCCLQEPFRDLPFPSCCFPVWCSGFCFR